MFWSLIFFTKYVYLSANDFANRNRSAHLAVEANPAERCPYTSIDKAPSEQWSMNSSVTGITNCLKKFREKLFLFLHFLLLLLCIFTENNSSQMEEDV